MLEKKAVIDLVKSTLWPALSAEKDRLARIDRWLRWDHDAPFTPHGSSQEYKELAARAQAPWGRRVVTAVTDQLYVEGYRASRAAEEAAPWEFWQANGLDSKQIPVHFAATAYGLAYAVVLPGRSFTGEAMPRIRGLDPSQMIAVYDDPAWDDWPQYALRAEPARVDGDSGWKLTLYDATNLYYLTTTSIGDKVDFVGSAEHGVGTCPVVRFANQVDLRGRADGEVEPFIPMLGRIDQTAFDRLIVQRFSSWVVRTIAGMAPADKLDGESDYAYAERTKMRLAAEKILVAADPDTKFGSLPATPLEGFIAAHDADVRALAAVSQTPVHELIGQMANMSADALAAAESSLTRKIEARKHSLGESWEQTLRLAALVMGDMESARDTSSQVRWRDMESRSLNQAADALGKIAQMLGVPVEMLWEKIPGWTQQDVDRAKTLVEQGGGLEALMRELAAGQTSPEPQPA